MILSLSIFILAASLGAKASPRHVFWASQPSVTLDYGTFVGSKNDTTGISSFLGIPFTDPPVGTLRWRAPVFPPSKHLGIVNATQPPNMCIQASKSAGVDLNGTSEDCLFLNIWLPAETTSKNSLPVVVWFHGGGYQTGTPNEFNPVDLIQSSASPMIFVSIAYRLGAFGFLAGSAIGADGTLNAGLHDQRAGLRWVKKYIKEFGGNPSQVTIWGQSAGASSTMFHLLINGGDTEGLFHRAIGNSPALLPLPLFSDKYYEDNFDRFATFAGCDPTHQTKVLSCLRSAESHTLASAGVQVLREHPSTLFVFSPTLDGEFLPIRPVEGFTRGGFARVPVLYGGTADEGDLWWTILDPSVNVSSPNATETTVFKFLQAQYPSFTEASFHRALWLYPLSDYNNSFSSQAAQMFGDMLFLCPAFFITQGVAVARSPAFHYHYDNPHLLSLHGSDSQAFFPEGPTVSPIQPDANDEALFQAMRGYWTSFITSGRPTSNNIWDANYNNDMVPMVMKKTTRNRAPNWDRVSNPRRASPRMSLEPGDIHMEDVMLAFSERCAFWRSLSLELKI